MLLYNIYVYIYIFIILHKKYTGGAKIIERN